LSCTFFFKELVSGNPSLSWLSDWARIPIPLRALHPHACSFETNIALRGVLLCPASSSPRSWSELVSPLSLPSASAPPQAFLTVHWQHCRVTPIHALLACWFVLHLSSQKLARNWSSVRLAPRQGSFQSLSKPCSRKMGFSILSPGLHARLLLAGPLKAFKAIPAIEACAATLAA